MSADPFKAELHNLLASGTVICRCGFATELFEENAILFLKVIDHRLLMSVHPANDVFWQYRQRRCAD
jgi:hypothetical protein